jgi:hypothetical protein
MEMVKLEGMNRELGAPKGWDEEKHGKCEPLPVFAEVVNGHICMTSAWKPSAEELASLNAGAAVALVIYGSVHPPVAVGVFEPPSNVTHYEGREECPVLAEAHESVREALEKGDGVPPAG